MAEGYSRNPWKELHEILEARDPDRLHDHLERLGPAETARAISRMEQEDQTRLLLLLEPADAADLIEEVPDVQAIDLIEDLEPARAAAIVDEMDSDRQADLLSVLSDEEAEAILQRMSPEEAQEARELMGHARDTAGGIMIKEYLAYSRTERISEVLADLQTNRDKYSGYDVQYLFVLDERARLIGVLRMRDLLFPERTSTLEQLMLRDPLTLSVGAPISAIVEFFDQHRLYGVPVVDDQQRLVGVVLPEDVEEAARKQSDREFLGVTGIVGGEEIRTLPLLLRSRRRLSWLSINIVLNIVAASVIAYYQDTLSAAIALAVFLPMISDMSGCSGNQAVAVSVRELSLGLVRPEELRHVFFKESSLGILNGLCLGLLLGGAAFLWNGSPWLGLVVGGALAVNTLVAVCIGGLLPLALKRIGLDPALVSGPLLTTVTDMFGFFLVLSSATLLLPQLTGAA
jgi:magnesium transporter